MKIGINDGSMTFSSSIGNTTYVDANFSASFPYTNEIDKLIRQSNLANSNVYNNLFITNEVLPNIRDVRFFNNKTTVVWWSDGSKTVVVCQDCDTFDKEKGLTMAIVKKIYGNKGNFNNIFRKWIYDKE